MLNSYERFAKKSHLFCFFGVLLASMVQNTQNLLTFTAASLCPLVMSGPLGSLSSLKVVLKKNGRREKNG